MRILFLDDSHERQTRFKYHRVGTILVQAYTHDEAINALKNQIEAFDEAHLDHDLSEAASAGRPDPGERTGQDVARFIVEMQPHLRPKKIILHSFNFAGRTRMAQILNDAGIGATIAPWNLLGS